MITKKTKAEKIREMSDQELSDFLTELILDQDAINNIYSEFCDQICPISHEKCPIHAEDSFCSYKVNEIVYHWLQL